MENEETVDQFGRRGKLTCSQCGSVELDVAHGIPLVVGDAQVDVARFTLLWNLIHQSTP